MQDGFDLYQQYFILSDEGEWTSISQGMNRGIVERGDTTGIHLPFDHSLINRILESSVLSDKKVLNFVDEEAGPLRDNVVALTREKPKEIIEAVREAELPDRHDVQKSDVNLARLGAVMKLAYNRDIEKFDDLVMMHGVGPRTLKALAMASEVIHGDATRFDDPARFSFAVGGKDGRPHPIDEKSFDETVEMLQNSVDRSKLGNKDKSSALKRLHKIAVKESRWNTPRFSQRFDGPRVGLRREGRRQNVHGQRRKRRYEKNHGFAKCTALREAFRFVETRSFRLCAG